MPDRSVSYRFLGNFTNLTAGLTTAGRNVTELGTKLVALDRNGQKMRGGLTQIGDTAGKVGLVMAAGVAVAVRAAANFEQAMSNVQAATHETADNMDLLRQAALDAGQATKFSATESAAAIENLAKAGVSTADILDGGLAGALDLAAAGNLEVAEAAEYTATALTQFQLAGDQAAHVADLLAAGAGKAQGEVRDMALALNYAGVPASNLGVSIEETAGTIALLAKNGVIGEQAGTSLRGMLASLTSPSIVAKKEMEKLGITVVDASGQFVGFEGIAGQLQERLGGLTDAERANALGRIFGNEQLQAANVLYREGATGISEWTANVDDQGYAADTAAIKMDNLKGDLEQLGGAFETALIGAGGGSQGPLRTLVQGATDAVNAFNKLPDPIKSTVTALGGITAITGGALFFGSRAIQGIANTRQALQDLGVESDRLKGALKGLGIAAGGLVALQVVGQLVSELEERTDRAVPGVQALTKSLLDLQSAEGAAALEEQIGNLGEALANVDADGLRGLTNDVYAFRDSGSALGTTLKGLQFVGTFGSSFFADDGKALREAEASIDAVDEALANIVTSGSAEQAESIFAQLAAAQGLSADEQKALLGLLPQYNEALDGSANAATLAADATGGLAGPITAAGDAAGDAAADIADMVEAMEDQRAAALEAFDAITGYRQAMKDADKQAKESNAGIKGNSDEALKNRDTLSALAGAWNSLDRTTQGANGAFKAARQNFIDTATAMGVPKRAARELANQILEIPEKKVIPVSTPGADESRNKLAAIKGFLDSLHDKTINVTVNRRGGVTSSAGGRSADPDGSANGSTVPKSGRGYADRYHYMLADGEEVISNRYGQADRHRGLLKAINANRLAGGGTAGVYVKRSGQRDPEDKAGAVYQAVDYQAGRAARSLKDLKDAVDKSQKSLDKETASRDQIADMLASMAGSITSGLKSTLFETSGGPWAGGLGGVAGANATLTSDIANAQMFGGLVQSLQGRGLSGGALNALIAENDVSLLRQFAGAGQADLDKYQALFTQRDQITAATGQGIANSIYGDELVRQTRVAEDQRNELREANRKLQRLEQAIERADKNNQDGHKGNGEYVAASVNGAVGNGHRRGKRSAR